jgi:WD40 repeat protein/membrane-bound lytic murein transglycosylase
VSNTSEELDLYPPGSPSTSPGGACAGDRAASGGDSDGTGAARPTTPGVPAAGPAAPEWMHRLWQSFPPDVRQRYRLDGVLGEGGMGILVKARDLQMGREVALKGLRAPGNVPLQSRERLRREVRTAASLSHPNILPVYDTWTDRQGNPWCSMLRVPGEGPTLARRLAQLRPLSRIEDRPLGELIQIFLQVCRAVQYAHSQGYLHRDIKPDNILLGPSGEALVADWGLAVPLAAATGGLPDIGGTHGYSAPEQLGQTGPPRADGRSDVFALGMVLYEMIGGRPGAAPKAPPRPSGAPGARAGTAPTGGPSPAPHARYAPISISARVPRELAAIIARAAALDPGHRQPSVADLIHDVEVYLGGGMLEGVGYTLTERAARWLRRNPVGAGMLAVVLAVSATTAVSTALLVSKNRELVAANDRTRSEAVAKESALSDVQEANRTIQRANRDLVRANDTIETQNRELVDTNAALKQAVHAKEEESAGRKLALREAVFSLVALAERQLLDGDPDRAGEILDGCQEDLRGWEWRYLRALCRKELRRFVGHRGPVTAVAASPDGTRIATAGADGTVRVSALSPAGRPPAANGPPPIVLAAHAGPVRAVRFSRDGRLVATSGSDGTARIWELAVARPRASLSGSAIAFLPDGDGDGNGGVVTAGGDDGSLRFWDVRGAPAGRAIEREGERVHGLAVSPDGSRIAVIDSGGTVELREAASGRVERRIPPRAGAWAADAAFSPDGRRLAIARSDGTAAVIDVATGVERLALAGHGDAVAAVAVAAGPDGSRIATAGPDRIVRLWDADSGRALAAFRGHGGNVRALAFGPGARWVVSAGEDGTARVWETSTVTSRRVVTLRGHSAGVTAVAFAADGATLATAGADRTVCLWDVEAGVQRLRLEGHSDGVFSVAISPDGRRLASASLDRTVRVWEMPPPGVAPQPASTIRGDGARAYWSVAFAPDGTRIAAGNDAGTLEVRAVPDLEHPVLSIAAHRRRINGIAFAPDGTRIAAASADGTATVFGARDGRRLLALTGHADSVESVAFSPGGRWIVTGSSDHTARVWEAGSGRTVRVLRGHTRALRSVAVSPDAQRIVTAGDDGTARIWDAEGGRELLVLRAHSRPVNAVAFSPDGRRIATASADQTIALWDPDPAVESPGPSPSPAAPHPPQQSPPPAPPSPPVPLPEPLRARMEACLLSRMRDTGPIASVHALLLAAHYRHILANHHAGLPGAAEALRSLAGTCLATSEETSRPLSLEPPAAARDLIDGGRLSSLAGAVDSALARSRGRTGSFPFGTARVRAEDLARALETFRDLLREQAGPAELARALSESFDVHRSPGCHGSGEVLFTAYATPVYAAAPAPGGPYRYPLYRDPGGDLTRRFDRAAIYGGALAGRGLEIAWLADPLDELDIHVEGEGLLRLPDGSYLDLRFAAKNEKPYRGLVPAMVRESVFQPWEADMLSARRHFREHPDRWRHFVDQNQSFVFFDATPVATMPARVAGIAERSAAVDPSIFPRGMLAFADTRAPVYTPEGKLTGFVPWRRFVVGEDEGGVVKGPAHVDLYLGPGEEAQRLAATMKEAGRLYLLLPRGTRLDGKAPAPPAPAPLPPPSATRPPPARGSPSPRAPRTPAPPPGGAGGTP